MTDVLDELRKLQAENAELRATVERMEDEQSAAIQAAALAGWMIAALRGEPVSDFAESFEPVRKCQEARAILSRDAKEPSLSELKRRNVQAGRPMSEGAKEPSK